VLKEKTLEEEEQVKHEVKQEYNKLIHAVVQEKTIESKIKIEMTDKKNDIPVHKIN